VADKRTAGSKVGHSEKGRSARNGYQETLLQEATLDRAQLNGRVMRQNSISKLGNRCVSKQAIDTAFLFMKCEISMVTVKRDLSRGCTSSGA
jgi:hypothetical protein